MKVLREEIRSAQCCRTTERAENQRCEYSRCDMRQTYTRLQGQSCRSVRKASDVEARQTRQLILINDEDVRRLFQRCLHCVYVRQAEHLSATTLKRYVVDRVRLTSQPLWCALALHDIQYSYAACNARSSMHVVKRRKTLMQPAARCHRPLLSFAQHLC